MEVAKHEGDDDDAIIDVSDSYDDDDDDDGVHNVHDRSYMLDLPLSVDNHLLNPL